MTINYAKKIILTELKHLRKFYKTDAEFKKHLFSGEVKMPITDVVKLLANFKKGDY